MNVMPKMAIIRVTVKDSKYSRIIDFGGPFGFVSGSAFGSFSSLLIISRSYSTLTLALSFSRDGFSVLKYLQGLARRHHLGRFDRASHALGPTRVPRRFNVKRPLMRLAFRSYQRVDGTGKPFGLKYLLQERLIVNRAFRRDISKFFGKHPGNERTCGSIARIEKDGSDDSFERVGEDCLLSSPAGLFFAATDPDQFTDVQGLRDLRERCHTDEPVLHQGQLTFGCIRIF